MILFFIGLLIGIFIGVWVVGIRYMSKIKKLADEEMDSVKRT